MIRQLAQRWRDARFDKPFFWIVVLLVVAGLFVFASAALSELPRSPAIFNRMLLGQLVLGLAGGVIAGVVTFRVPYTFWKRVSLYLFIAALVLTVLVFIPGISLSHGGATRWLSLGPLSFSQQNYSRSLL